jgi:hypothetical protein
MQPCRHKLLLFWQKNLLCLQFCLVSATHTGCQFSTVCRHDKAAARQYEVDHTPVIAGESLDASVEEAL